MYRPAYHILGKKQTSMLLLRFFFTYHHSMITVKQLHNNFRYFVILYPVPPLIVYEVLNKSTDTLFFNISHFLLTVNLSITFLQELI